LFARDIGRNTLLGQPVLTEDLQRGGAGACSRGTSVRTRYWGSRF
jgi:hypothetical protein